MQTLTMLSRRSWFRWLVAGMFVGIWLVLAFAHLYRFALPTMDSWCYLAPGAFARHAGDLSLPLLGDFQGADHIWGIHWPGAVLLYSLFLPLLPADGVVYVGLICLLWLMVAWLAFRLVRVWTDDFWLAAAAAAFVLCDRAMFAIAQLQRPEFVAAAILLALAYELTVASATRRAWGIFILSGMGILVHPLLFVAAAVWLVVSLFLLRNPVWKRSAVATIAGVAAGSVALAAYFGLQPVAFAQLRDHSGQAVSTFAPGTMVFHALREFYVPNFSGWILFAAALGGLAMPGWLGMRSANSKFGAPIALLLGSLLLAHLAFHNTYYLAAYAPLAICVGLCVLREWGNRVRIPTPAAVATVSILLVVHASFWVARTLKYRESGFVDLRADIREIWQSLPVPAHRVFIPVSFWEIARAEKNASAERILLRGIPYRASVPRRALYEKYVAAMMQSGDLLIMDGCDGSPPPTTPLDPDQFDVVRERDKILPGRVPWGYQITVYRKR